VLSVSYCLCNTADQSLYLSGNRSRGCLSVGNPNKSYQQRLVVGNGVEKGLLCVAVGFTHLPLDTVAVDGVLEALLGNTDKYLYGNVGLTARHLPENGSQRKCRHGRTAAAEERLYQSGADNVLAFLKLGVQCW